MNQRDCNTKAGQILTVSAKELALMLGVSPRQIWRLNTMGKLPRPIRLGGSIKWKLNEITEWVDNNCPNRESWEAMKETSK